MKGEIIIFSIVWDKSKERFKVKRTAILSLDEVMNTHSSYNTHREALKITRIMNKKGVRQDVRLENMKETD